VQATGPGWPSSGRPVGRSTTSTRSRAASEGRRRGPAPAALRISIIRAVPSAGGISRNDTSAGRREAQRATMAILRRKGGARSRNRARGGIPYRPAAWDKRCGRPRYPVCRVQRSGAGARGAARRGVKERACGSCCLRTTRVSRMARGGTLRRRIDISGSLDAAEGGRTARMPWQAGAAPRPRRARALAARPALPYRSARQTGHLTTPVAGANRPPVLAVSLRSGRAGAFHRLHHTFLTSPGTVPGRRTHVRFIGKKP